MSLAYQKTYSRVFLIFKFGQYNCLYDENNVFYPRGGVFHNLGVDETLSITEGEL